jgi:AmpD protein
MWRTQHEDDRPAPQSGVQDPYVDAHIPLQHRHHPGFLAMFHRINGPAGSTAILDSQGWLKHVRHLPSPNCDARPDGTSIRLIVIHNISLPPGIFDGNAVIELFTNQLDWDTHPYFQEIRGLRVSAHFFIRRDGEPIQFVPCGMRAWHAGVSSWRGHEQCNDFSIGIELEGTDDLPFAEAQYDTLTALVRTLREAYPIEAVTGHANIAPGRKTDPGPHFDWRRLEV